MTSIIEQNNQIPEMYQMRHKHDANTTVNNDYVDNALLRGVSGALMNNDNLNMFMTKLNSMYVCIVDTILPVRNIFYWSTSKYYNGHGK